MKEKCESDPEGSARHAMVFKRRQYSNAGNQFPGARPLVFKHSGHSKRHGRKFEPTQYAEPAAGLSSGQTLHHYFDPRHRIIAAANAAAALAKATGHKSSRTTAADADAPAQQRVHPLATRLQRIHEQKEHCISLLLNMHEQQQRTSHASSPTAAATAAVGVATSQPQMTGLRFAESPVLSTQSQHSRDSMYKQLSSDSTHSALRQSSLDSIEQLLLLRQRSFETAQGSSCAATPRATANNTCTPSQAFAPVAAAAATTFPKPAAAAATAAVLPPSAADLLAALAAVPTPAAAAAAAAVPKPAEVHVLQQQQGSAHTTESALLLQLLPAIAAGKLPLSILQQLHPLLQQTCSPQLAAAPPQQPPPAAAAADALAAALPLPVLLQLVQAAVATLQK